MAEKIIGIDLGTSNSAASVMQGGKPTLIPAAEGTTVAGKAFPSVVAFSKDGELLVCLLYTSPSPRDRSVSRMPSSA